MLSSTSCPNAGWYGPATTSLSFEAGSVISSVFWSPTLITCIFFLLNKYNNSLHLSTACGTVNGLYSSSSNSLSNYVPFITNTG